MAKPGSKDPTDYLVPSILDRLLGSENEDEWYTLDEMYVAVRRDLEDLLNTHEPPAEIPEGFDFLKRSVAVYGLPDLASLVLRSEREGLGVSVILEDILSRFEPRLRDIHVRQIADPNDEKQFLMKFQIEARMAVDPYPQVAFETILELSTGRTFVAGGEPS
jgi:type VI secretion system protein ImpF